MKARFRAQLLLVLLATPALASAHGGPPAGSMDWPTYGHDAHHTFHGRTTLNRATVHPLAPAWDGVYKFEPLGRQGADRPLSEEGGRT